MAEWWWKADYFETCNCAYGCPCNLNSIPTDGTCHAIDCWRITAGASGDVRLDGLKLALIVAWPNAIFEGNGKAVIFVGDEANEAQREALMSSFADPLESVLKRDRAIVAGALVWVTAIA